MLAVAGGSRYSYFGHDDWAPHAPELKTLDGALDLRDRILSAFEAAEVEDDPAERQAWLTFVVVGAGPTGVEMAGQIAELARDALPAEYRHVDTRAARVLLVEAGDRVLSAFSPSLSRERGAPARLPRRDAAAPDDRGRDRRAVDRDRAPRREPRTRRGADEGLGGGRRGLAARAAARGGRRCRDRPRGQARRRARPDRSRTPGGLRVRRHDRRARQRRCTASRRSRCSRAGTSRARSATARAQPFHYNDKGELATIGRARAVGVVKGIPSAASPRGLLWLGIHIVYLVGFQNRVLVLTRWAFAYVTRGRGARVIHR